MLYVFCFTLIAVDGYIHVINCCLSIDVYTLGNVGACFLFSGSCNSCIDDSKEEFTLYDKPNGPSNCDILYKVNFELTCLNYIHCCML